MNGSDGDPEPDRSTARRWHLAGRVGAVLGLAIAGAVIGLIVGLFTPTHGELVGNEVTLRLVPGQHYDQVDIAGALTGKRATSRTVLGEPVGFRASLNVDADFLFRADGSFNSDVLPAYLQAYSDPAQVVGDLRSAIVRHLAWSIVIGAAVGIAIGVGGLSYRRWRARYDQRHEPSVRALARAYRSPERRFARRTLVALVVLAVLDLVPGAAHEPPHDEVISADPILADTPLAGTELSGLLRPAIAAAESYVHTYFADTDRYYGQLRDALSAYLATDPVTLPSGPDIVQFGFVTDRHCNIGMDRVVMELLKHYGITTLVSGGDDDFSGSFPFESACTSDLAEKSRHAGITDVFAAGNHDSAQTLADERAQRIEVLDNKVVDVGALHFLGSPDPRSSRYGEGIQPSSAADQRAVIDAQAARVGEVACNQDQPVIVVLHDPNAGAGALQSGCGKAVLALDGHTHMQAGPTPVTLPDGGSGAQFVGASSGGAPSVHSVDRSFASALTVGPLNHDATVNIVSYDTSIGQLVGVTVFRFTPEQQISTEQLTP